MQRLYRITLVGNEWHVMRPLALLPHAFSKLEHAEGFVCRDCQDEQALVEIIAGSAYMVKSLRAHDRRL